MQEANVGGHELLSQGVSNCALLRRGGLDR